MLSCWYVNNTLKHDLLKCAANLQIPFAQGCEVPEDLSDSSEDCFAFCLHQEQPTSVVHPPSLKTRRGRPR